MTQVNNVIRINELIKLCGKAEARLDGAFQKIFRLNLFLPTVSKTIFFPLHNRYHLGGEDYPQYFERIRSLKRFFDHVHSEKMKIIMNFEAGPTEPALSDEELEEGVARKRPIPKSKKKKPIDRLPTSQQQSALVLQGLAPPEQDSLLDHEPLIPSSVHNEQIFGPSQVVTVNRCLDDAGMVLEQEKLFRDRAIEPSSPSQPPADARLHASARLGLNSKADVLKLKYMKKFGILVALNSVDKQPRFASKYLEAINGKSQALADLDDFQSLNLYESEYLSKVARRYGPVRLYYSVDNNQLVDEVVEALVSSRPLRDRVYRVFQNRDIEDFRDAREPDPTLPISHQFSITFWNSLDKLPEAALRDYFGEKICLFFAFISFYRDWLVPISVLGALNSAIDFYYRSDPIYDTEEGAVEKTLEGSALFFCLFSVAWCCYFTLKWRRFEANYSLRYGRYNTQAEKYIRTSFEGKIERCPITDKINRESQDDREIDRKRVLMVLVFLAIYGLITVCCFYLLKLKRRAYKEKWVGFKIIPQLSASQIIFDFAEFIRNLLFQKLITVLVRKLVKWQNHKYVEDHENRLILYLSLFQLYNNCCQIFIVCVEFMSGNSEQFVDKNGNTFYRVVSEDCIEQDCVEELAFYVGTYWCLLLLWRFIYHLLFKTLLIKASNRVSVAVFQGIKNLKEYIGVKAKSKKNVSKNLALRAGRRKPTAQDHSSFNNNQQMVSGIYELLKKLENAEFAQKAEKNNAVTAQFESHHALYKDLDRVIDEQTAQLEDYNVDEDIDPLVFAYFNLLNTFCFVVLFGMFFSLGYFFCWLISLVDLYVTRRHLLFDTKRPRASSTTSIGLWIDMVQLYTALCIPIYSFYFGMLFFYDKSTAFRFYSFLVTFMAFAFVYFVFACVVNELDDIALIKILRSEFIGRFIFHDHLNKDRMKQAEMVVDGSEQAVESPHLHLPDRPRGKLQFEAQAEAQEKARERADEVVLKLMEYRSRAAASNKPLSREDYQTLRRLMASEQA